jgi:hypothetical protein
MNDDLDVYYSDCEEDDDCEEEYEIQQDPYKQIDKACIVYEYIRSYIDQNSLPICQNLSALHIFELLN